MNIVQKIVVLITLCVGIQYALAKEPKPFLETRFHNPVDTCKLFHGTEKSLILFVHSYYNNCRSCMTKKWQYFLQEDSLGILINNNINLYIVYESAKPEDVLEFDNHNRINATYILDSDYEFRKYLSESRETPFAVSFNNGNTRSILGGQLIELFNFIEQSFDIDIICKNCDGSGLIKVCKKCDGTGRVTPKRNGGPDEIVGICPLCGGKGFPEKCSGCKGTGLKRNRINR